MDHGKLRATVNSLQPLTEKSTKQQLNITSKVSKLERYYCWRHSVNRVRPSFGSTPQRLSFKRGADLR